MTELISKEVTGAHTLGNGLGIQYPDRSILSVIHSLLHLVSISMITIWKENMLLIMEI